MIEGNGSATVRAAGPVCVCVRRVRRGQEGPSVGDTVGVVHMRELGWLQLMCVTSQDGTACGIVTLTCMCETRDSSQHVTGAAGG